MPGRVLLIEDEPHIVEAIRFLLVRDGWEVASHGEGTDALAVIRATRPDLVILDVMLPGRSGYDILQDLRAEAGLAGLPVLMLTARGQSRDREMAERLGASRYMAKPFSNAEVLAAVRELAACGVGRAAGQGAAHGAERAVGHGGQGTETAAGHAAAPGEDRAERLGAAPGEKPAERPTEYGAALGEKRAEGLAGHGAAPEAERPKGAEPAALPPAGVRSEGAVAGQGVSSAGGPTAGHGASTTRELGRPAPEAVARPQSPAPVEWRPAGMTAPAGPELPGTRAPSQPIAASGALQAAGQDAPEPPALVPEPRAAASDPSAPASEPPAAAIPAPSTGVLKAPSAPQAPGASARPDPNAGRG